MTVFDGQLYSRRARHAAPRLCRHAATAPRRSRSRARRRSATRASSRSPARASTSRDRSRARPGAVGDRRAGAAPRLVRDIRPGPEDSGVAQLTAVGSTLFFVAHDGRHGIELWKSDGTPDGTVLVKTSVPARRLAAHLSGRGRRVALLRRRRRRAAPSSGGATAPSRTRSSWRTSAGPGRLRRGLPGVDRQLGLLLCDERSDGRSCGAATRATAPPRWSASAAGSRRLVAQPPHAHRRSPLFLGRRRRSTTAALAHRWNGGGTERSVRHSTPSGWPIRAGSRVRRRVAFAARDAGGKERLWLLDAAGRCAASSRRALSRRPAGRKSRAVRGFHGRSRRSSGLGARTYEPRSFRRARVLAVVEEILARLREGVGRRLTRGQREVEQPLEELGLRSGVGVAAGFVNVTVVPTGTCMCVGNSRGRRRIVGNPAARATCRCCESDVDPADRIARDRPAERRRLRRRLLRNLHRTELERDQAVAERHARGGAGAVRNAGALRQDRDVLLAFDLVGDRAALIAAPV